MLHANQLQPEQPFRSRCPQAELQELGSDNNVSLSHAEGMTQDLDAVTHSSSDLVGARSARSSRSWSYSIWSDTFVVADLDAGEARLHRRRTLPAVESEGCVEVIAVVQTHEGTHHSLRPQCGQT